MDWKKEFAERERKHQEEWKPRLDEMLSWIERETQSLMDYSEGKPGDKYLACYRIKKKIEECRAILNYKMR